MLPSRPAEGFTLAEVLITLGIIGIVAAMTMPTLIAKYQKKVTVNKLRKAYAEIAQAVQLSEAEYGMVDTWSFSNFSNVSEDSRSQANALIKEYIIKQLKTTKVCEEEELEKCTSRVLKGLSSNSNLTPSLYVVTESGYGIGFHYGGTAVGSPFSPHIHMYVDVDGPLKGSNTVGKDSFQISLNLGKQRAVEGGVENRDKKSGLVMFGSGWNPPLTREELKNRHRLGCSKNYNGAFCGALIEMDGWEIKDDYPW